ncbi:hypothetical protein ATK17_1847 [Branchiibius hedensis]|uniref:Uncharacterized protein n=1 Tax=Branchiibius hedensis TaxID=672460 RepID=A0A2Y8ZRK0_9MICO|nr:hypothetical protein [Branchiibius hedensis]PWJ25711.1 hypothetical protein ATK17_1847 [Branchiibius hedensis]SSA34524.1 hypothetical protein SAMN04489750_1847 [Branchiibius hedensis]
MSTLSDPSVDLFDAIETVPFKTGRVVVAITEGDLDLATRLIESGLLTCDVDEFDALHIASRFDFATGTAVASVLRGERESALLGIALMREVGSAPVKAASKPKAARKPRPAKAQQPVAELAETTPAQQAEPAANPVDAFLSTDPDPEPEILPDEPEPAPEPEPVVPFEPEPALVGAMPVPDFDLDNF